VIRSAAVAAAVVVGGCGGATSPAGSFTFTAPEGFGQLVPTRTVEIGWSWTGDPDTLDRAWADIGLVAAGGEVSSIFAGSPVPPSGITWDGAVVTGPSPPRAGFYTLAADLQLDTGPLHVDDDARFVVVQGVDVSRPAPGDTVESPAGATVDLGVTTSTIAPIDLRVVLDPDRAADGDEIAIEERAVAAEFQPVPRVVRFAGTDAGGAAVPPGDYVVAAVVTDRATGVTYRVDGGTLRYGSVQVTVAE